MAVIVECWSSVGAINVGSRFRRKTNMSVGWERRIWMEIDVTTISSVCKQKLIIEHISLSQCKIITRQNGANEWLNGCYAKQTILHDQKKRISSAISIYNNFSLFSSLLLSLLLWQAMIFNTWKDKRGRLSAPDEPSASSSRFHPFRNWNIMS